MTSPPPFHAQTGPIPESSINAIYTYIGTTTILVLTALCASAGRIAPRARQCVSLRLDDWLMLLAMSVAIVAWALQLAGVVPYLHPDAQIPDLEAKRSLIQLTGASVPPWILAMALIKISLLFTLLSLRDGTCWRILLWGMIALLAVSAITDTSVFIGTHHLTNSIACMTGQSPLCIKIITISTYIESVVNIGTDVIVSLLPITFVLQLRRPLREKVLICGLMAMGLIVSGASIRKAYIVSEFSNPAFPVLEWVSAVNMWACVEMFFGVTAACMPRLKSALERLLFRLGFNVAVIMGKKEYRTADELPDFPLKVLASVGAHESPANVDASRYSIMPERIDSLGENYSKNEEAGVRFEHGV